MTVVGTELPIRSVRFAVVIGGKADVPGTSQDRRK
jgi:hypothetical protein